MTAHLAPHETLDLHELLAFKTTGCTKASTMKGLVTFLTYCLPPRLNL